MGGLVLGELVERFGCEVVVSAVEMGRAYQPRHTEERQRHAMAELLARVDAHAQLLEAPTVVVLTPWEHVERAGYTIYRRHAILHRRDPEPVVFPKPAR